MSNSQGHVHHKNWAGFSNLYTIHKMKTHCFSGDMKVNRHIQSFQGVQIKFWQFVRQVHHQGYYFSPDHGIVIYKKSKLNAGSIEMSMTLKCWT